MAAASGPFECEFDVEVGDVARGEAKATYEIEGTCLSGEWAVNRELIWKPPDELEYGPTWTVTHVPTGRALLAGIPSKAVAVAVARRLVQVGVMAPEGDPAAASAALGRQGVMDLKAQVRDAVDRQRPAQSIRQMVARWSPPASPRKTGATTPSPASRRRRGVADPEMAAMHEEYKRLAARLRKATNPRGTPPLSSEQIASKRELLLW